MQRPLPVPQSLKQKTPGQQPGANLVPIPQGIGLARAPRRHAARSHSIHPRTPTKRTNRPVPPLDVMLRAVAASITERQPQEQTAPSPSTPCHKRPKHPPQNTSQMNKPPPSPASTSCCAKSQHPPQNTNQKNKPPRPPLQRHATSSQSIHPRTPTTRTNRPRPPPTSCCAQSQQNTNHKNRRPNPPPRHATSGQSIHPRTPTANENAPNNFRKAAATPTQQKTPGQQPGANLVPQPRKWRAC